MRQLFIPALIVVLVIGAGVTAFLAVRQPGVDEVARRFVAAHASGDAAAVYGLAAAADKRFRTAAAPLAGPWRGLADALRQQVQVDVVTSQLQADTAVATVHGRWPDPADPRLAAYHRAARSLPGAAATTTVELTRLQQLVADGQLPLVPFEQHLELVREQDGWKVFLNWAPDYTLRLGTSVMNDLPLAFTVEPPVVQLRPGAVVSAMFHVENTSGRTLRIKAGHRFEPALVQLHTQLLQCFCFAEDTLGPGEAKDLPVVLRLGWSIPAEPTELALVYEYYDLEQFIDRRVPSAESAR